MVLASARADSDSRLAARPVGAHSSTFPIRPSSSLSRLLTMVVLPTPGPPVNTVTLPWSTVSRAWRWEGERMAPVSASTRGRAAAASMRPQGGTPASRRRRWPATPASAWVEGRQEDRGLAVQGFRHQVGGRGLHLDGPFDRLGRHLQELRGALRQPLPFRGAVSFRRQFPEHVVQGGPHPDHGIGRDAQLPGDDVRGDEADAADVEGQAVGVVPDAADGVFAVHPVDARGPGAADAVGVQEDHDVPGRPSARATPP